MWKDIFVAFVGGVLVLAVQLAYEHYSSVNARKDLPDIAGTQWDASWIENNGKSLPHDTVTFSKWTKNNLFEGTGAITYPDHIYHYRINGEVTQGRILVMTYRAEGYPTESIIGTACLKFSSNAKDLDGSWIGFKGDAPAGGTVNMRRVR